MDVDTWWDCYDKLTKAYQKTKDTEQSKIYFEALQTVPGPVIRLAISKTIREEKYWPNPATIRDYCDGATHDLMLPASSCQNCHGSTWVPAPDRVLYERTYQFVRRCPECWVLDHAE
jgi:hypothetical protein